MAFHLIYAFMINKVVNVPKIELFSNLILIFAACNNKIKLYVYYICVFASIFPLSCKLAIMETNIVLCLLTKKSIKQLRSPL